MRLWCRGKRRRARNGYQSIAFDSGSVLMHESVPLRGGAYMGLARALPLLRKVRTGHGELVVINFDHSPERRTSHIVGAYFYVVVQVSYEEGHALAERWGVPFLECSAKANVNVDEVFSALIREVERDNGLLVEESKGGCIIL